MPQKVNDRQTCFRPNRWPPRRAAVLSTAELCSCFSSTVWQRSVTRVFLVCARCFSVQCWAWTQNLALCDPRAARFIARRQGCTGRLHRTFLQVWVHLTAHGALGHWLQLDQDLIIPLAYIAVQVWCFGCWPNHADGLCLASTISPHLIGGTYTNAAMVCGFTLGRVYKITGAFRVAPAGCLPGA